MTDPQQATINRLRERGYTVHVVKYARDGIMLATINRRLTHGQMPLRIHRDGTYACQWYDTRNLNRRKDEACQS